MPLNFRQPERPKARRLVCGAAPTAWIGRGAPALARRNVNVTPFDPGSPPIAARAEVSKRTVYDYFVDKRRLFLAVLSAARFDACHEPPGAGRAPPHGRADYDNAQLEQASRRSRSTWAR
ncbi:helix-turn-helix domain-containing protein [Streptomyces sp. NPDC056462]|uniref:helix-turn-helix domain-containing protein n=1 Tax=Streptomyces sp. NPDC056462 TaxID=3345826 RepID=UPI0036C15E46